MWLNAANISIRFQPLTSYTSTTVPCEIFVSTGILMAGSTVTEAFNKCLGTIVKHHIGCNVAHDIPCGVVKIIVPTWCLVIGCFSLKSFTII